MPGVAAKSVGMPVSIHVVVTVRVSATTARAVRVVVPVSRVVARSIHAPLLYSPHGSGGPFLSLIRQFDTPVPRIN